MRIVYLDSDFKCHVSADGTMLGVQTAFFDGKCDTFIEGYRFVPNGQSWTRSDGEVFLGEMIAPWKDFDNLDAAQREYEKQLLVEYKENIMQYEMELSELDLTLLDIQYQNLIRGL